MGWFVSLNVRFKQCSDQNVQRQEEDRHHVVMVNVFSTLAGPLFDSWLGE